jgi:CHAD domain-containing protein
LPSVVGGAGGSASLALVVAVPEIGPTATTKAVIEHAIASCVQQMIRCEAGTRRGDDPESLHHYRVAARSLRSDLQIFSRFLDREQTRNLRGELHWLGGAVGPARDLDVLAERVRVHCAGLSAADAVGSRLLLAVVEGQQRAAHDVARDALGSHRHATLLEALTAAADQPPIASDAVAKVQRPAIRTGRKLVRRRWRRLVEAVAELDPIPEDASLHHIRILAKRCRYAAEAFVPVSGHPAARFGRAMEGLQTVLGELHDAVVAERWLRAAAADSPSAGVVAGQLVALERQQRDELRAAWPRAWHHASRARLTEWLS